MIDYSSEVTINVPAEKVFRVLTDASKYDMWTGMQHTESAGGSAMDHVGARVATEINEGPMKSKLVFEVSAFEPNRLLAFKTVSEGGMQWDAEYRLESQGSSATLLKQNGHIRLGGLMGLLSPLMRGEVDKKEKQEIEKLKELLEGGKV